MVGVAAGRTARPERTDEFGVRNRHEVLRFGNIFRNGKVTFRYLTALCCAITMGATSPFAFLKARSPELSGLLHGAIALRF
jgi:hypothetical protein